MGGMLASRKWAKDLARYGTWTPEWGFGVEIKNKLSMLEAPRIPIFLLQF